MFRAIVLPVAFAVFLWSGLAHAVPRYFVEDSSSVIKSYTMDDDVVAPAGHTAVDVSVIEAAYTGTIYQGGTWVVTGGVGVYTPPTGISTAIDDTTAIGGVQAACKNMLDVFDVALDYIADNQLAWQQAAIRSAETGIHYQLVNAARVALNGTRTHARRQKFCEESASWPTGLSGDVIEYVDAMGATGVATPSKDWSWVNPTTDARTDVMGAAQGFDNATDVETAPGSDRLISRSWIRDIQ